MQVVVDDGKFFLQTKFEERETVKKLGARWSAKRRQWSMDYSVLSVLILKASGAVENVDVLGDINEELFFDQVVYDGKRKDILSRIEPKRYFHQWYTTLRLLNRKRLAGFMFMGSGKTRMVLDAIQTAFSDRRISNALIAAPLSVVSVWRREIAKWLVVPYDMYCVVGSKEEKEAAIESVKRHINKGRLCIVVTNYESVIERDVIESDPFDEEAPKPTRMKEASAARHEFFGSFPWDFVVADESHRLQSRVAKVTKSMIRIADKAEYVTALTGTPISSSFQDLFAQLRFVDSRCFGGGFARFAEYFGVMGGWQGREIVALKSSAAQEFWDTVRRFAVVMGSEETMNLPPKIEENREYELYGDQLAAYRRLDKEFLIEVERVGAEGDAQKIPVMVRNALVKLQKLCEIASGFVISNSGETIRLHQNAKVRELEALIDEAGNEKIVIYTRYTEEVGIIRDALAKKRTMGVVAGGMSERERADTIRDFVQGESPRVLVVQVQAGGLGIDLSCARIAVFYSLPWGYASYEQACSRLHRPPQDKSVVVYRLIGSDIERKVASALATRESVVEVLFRKVTSPEILAGLADE